MWSCRGFMISGHSQHCTQSDLGAGTYGDAVVLETSSSSPSSSLLEGFVIQSALFVQLENSTGLLQYPTSLKPGVNWRPFSWILNCPMQPVGAQRYKESV